MNVKTTSLEGVLILEPRVFGDKRGFFQESFNQNTFNQVTGLNTTFVQDNHSKSSRGVLRGLHYQLPPNAQGKLVRVVRGTVLDIAVDIKKSSPTFGQWTGVELSEENHRQFWIPEGFAHGFIVLSESADFLYKTNGYYAPESERCIAWNDPDISVEWPDFGQPIISGKDAQGTLLKDAEVFE